MNTTPTSAPTGPPASPAIDPLERQARDFLVAGKFRKARDLFKLLCKREPARYRALLVEANLGLAHEMLTKGQTSEAKEVIAYLKTIAPPEAIASLELQQAARSGAAERYVPHALNILATQGIILPPEDRIRWADLLVTASAPLHGQTSEELRLATEVRAVQHALEALSSRQFERALELVRPLPNHSLLRHWRLFIKGLVAFHAGQPAKATRCLEELPAESAPGRAREPYLLLLGRRSVDGVAWTAPAIEFVGRLIGYAGWGTVLDRAEALWRQQQHGSSYQTVRAAVSSFPSDDLTPVGLLSDFYFNAVATLPEPACMDYTNLLMETEATHRTKNPVERMRILRACCLLLHRTVAPSMLREKWEAFLHEYQRVHGRNPRFASLGYGWLGETLAEPRPAFFSFQRRPSSQLRDAHGAVDALCKSIHLDPANLSAHLKLCDVYRAMRRTSDHNRLMDLMTVRFPDRKEVLAAAGRRCLDRKAYVKGLEYLDRALLLDKLDPTLPDSIVSGLLQLAAQYLTKGRADQARQTLAQAEPLLIDFPENLIRNPWCFFAQAASLEGSLGDPARATQLLAQAQAQSPDPAAALLYAHLAWAQRSRPNPNAFPLGDDLLPALHARPTAAGAARLLRVWRFCKDHCTQGALAQAQRWLADYLATAARHPIARDHACQVIETLQYDSPFSPHARTIVNAILQQDPADPLFRMYARFFAPASTGSPPARTRRTLQQILEEATRRGDQKAAALAQRELSTLHGHGPPGFEEPDADVVDPPEAPDVQPPESLLPLEAVFDMIEGLSPEQLESLRKTAPEQIPPELLEALDRAAQGAGPFGPGQAAGGPTPAPPARQPNPSAPPRRADPTQLHLL